MFLSKKSKIINIFIITLLCVFLIVINNGNKVKAVEGCSPIPDIDITNNYSNGVNFGNKMVFGIKVTSNATNYIEVGDQLVLNISKDAINYSSINLPNNLSKTVTLTKDEANSKVILTFLKGFYNHSYLHFEISTSAAYNTEQTSYEMVALFNNACSSGNKLEIINGSSITVNKAPVYNDTIFVSPYWQSSNFQGVMDENGVHYGSFNISETKMGFSIGLNTTRNFGSYKNAKLHLVNDQNLTIDLSSIRVYDDFYHPSPDNDLTNQFLLNDAIKVDNVTNTITISLGNITSEKAYYVEYYGMPTTDDFIRNLYQFEYDGVINTAYDFPLNSKMTELESAQEFGPSINVINTDYTLNSNETLTDSLKVTSKDNNDKPLKTIVINDGGFKITKPGQYTITYKTCDGSLICTEENALVTVHGGKLIRKFYDITTGSETTLKPDSTHYYNVGSIVDSSAIVLDDYVYIRSEVENGPTINDYDGDDVIVKYYYKQIVEGVVVRHQDTLGNRIGSDVFISSATKQIGDSFNISEITSTNYKVKTAPSLTQGSFSNTQQLFVYIYELKDGATVTVKHIDEDGNDIVTAEEIDGKVTEEFTTSATTSTNYQLKTAPTITTGTFTLEEQEFIYVYELKTGASVTVKHIDESGNNIESAEALNGKVTETFSTSAITTSTNYKLKTAPTITTGTFTFETQEFVYIYELKDGATVTVKHIDEDGNDIVTAEEIDGKVTEGFTTSATTSTNYQLKTAPTITTGTFTLEVQEFVYIYELKTGATVTVKHIDESGNNIESAEVLNGKVTETFSTSAITTSTNYQLKTAPTSTTGTFTLTAQEFIYIYELKDGATVTVKHVDEDGVDIVTSEELEGKVTTTFTTNAITDVNYTLVSSPSITDGTFTFDPQEFIYEYVRKDAGSISIIYLDELDNEIKRTENISGLKKLGLFYSIEVSQIDNYDFVAFEPANNNYAASHQLTFIEENQNIILRYKKRVGGNLIVKYLDEKGKVLSPDLIVDGKSKINEEYETKPINIKGYRLIKQSSNTKGIFTNEDIVIIYTYSKIDNNIITTGLNIQFAILISILASSCLFISYKKEHIN